MYRMNNNRKTLCLLALSTTALIRSTGFGMESNTNGPDKNKINIYGTLETRKTDEQGRPIIFGIDNISFGGIFENIPVYELPAPGDYNPNTRALQVDPTTKYLKVDMHLITKNNKPKIIEIRVDKPGIIWSFKDPQRSYAEKIDYVEITFKACDGSERTYLIDSRKKLSCDQQKAPFESMKVPLDGIKKLTIEGAKPREDKGNCACDATPTCTVTKQSTPNPLEEEGNAPLSTPSTSENLSHLKMPVPNSGSHFAPGMHK